MGIIEGGWEFVVGAYVVSAVVFVGYTASVLRRYAVELARAVREAREEEP
jgi:hypothetical protein